MVRFKNRYILVEVNPENKLDMKSVLNAAALARSIMYKVQQLHGDFGSAAIRTGFVTKYCQEQLRVALVRVRHGPHRFVASALPFITLVDNKRVIVNSLYTGATMKHCFKFLIKHQQKKIFTDLAKFKGTPQYEKLIKQYMDLTQIKGLSNL